MKRTIPCILLLLYMTFSYAQTTPNTSTSKIVNSLYKQFIKAERRENPLPLWQQIMTTLKNANVMGEVRNQAVSGNPYAQDVLGFVYYLGFGGLSQDPAQAAFWYRKAADQGLANAQYNLGVLYEKGQGMPQDYAQAAAWYRKAADQGNPDAQTTLGGLYDYGEGVPRDDAQAAFWYRKAADQGYSKAQFYLGVFYTNGLGVPQNLTLAVSWYRKAADQGLVAAQRNLGILYFKALGNSAEAERFLKLAAAQGDEDAADYLRILQTGAAK